MMSVKFFIYLFVSILVIWSIDSVNINQIFKKNKIYQARTCYIMIIICITYIVTNFVIDFSNCLG